MASRNLFTEEGRTRFRNFGLRLRSYLIVFLILGLLAGALWFLNRTRGEMGALERLYFRQYAKATAMSWISPARTGKYTLLTSGAIGVTDELVYQVRDEQGRPARNQYGWVFKPHAGVRIEEPRWRRVRSAHGAMEAWLRENIYGGESLPWLFAPALAVCLLTAMIGTAIALVIDQQVNRNYEKGNRLRGNRLVEPAEYVKEVKGADGLGLVVKSTKPETAVEKLKRAVARGAEPTWALRMKRSEEAQGAMILGDIGAGKSQIIHRLLRQIAARNNEAAVVYDPACEFVKAHYDERRGDVILNPLDERSPFWSPAFETRFRTDYQVLAEAFFPGRKAEKMQQSEQFFLNASRDIFARMLEFEPNPEQLVAWLADEEEIDRMCAGTELANYIRSDAAPQRAGVLGSLARVGKTLRILPRSEECDFDFSLTDWATERRGWIFLTSTKEAEERLRPLYASYLDLLMRRLMSVDDAWGRARPVKLIVDEVHTLQYLPSLYAAATEGRKYGLHLFQGTQNKHQYEDHYGKQAPTMLSCPRYTIVLRCKEPESARWLSTLLGEEEIDRPRTSVTASVSDQGRDSVNYSSQIERRAVVSMEQIANLPDLSGYWKYGELVVPFKLDFAPQTEISEGFAPRQSLEPARRAGVEKNGKSEAGKERAPTCAGGETQMRLKPDERRAVSQALE
jgi:type IV secretory pathway TraG/TraD family ATPase VirD4